MDQARYLGNLAAHQYIQSGCQATQDAQCKNTVADADITRGEGELVQAVNFIAGKVGYVAVGTYTGHGDLVSNFNNGAGAHRRSEAETVCRRVVGKSSKTGD